MSRTRASIRQVAERAGVSPMTVSNVLRRRADQVSEETRQRVLSAVEDLNYVPVRSSVQNRHVQTHCIGVLFLQDMTGAVGYPTFLGMCERSRQLDYDLTVLLRSESVWSKDGMEARFLDRRCDGYIFVGEERPDLSEALVRHEIPVVECYSVAPHAGVATVVGDNGEGIRQAVRRLVELGHRRIAHLAGPADHGEAISRREAFRAAMREFLGAEAPRNLDAWIVQGSSWGDLWGFEQYDDPGNVSRPLTEAVLALKPTAVVCANDMLALALWKMAELRSLSIPKDLSITGMDNVVEAQMRGVSSVSTPFEEIGRQAVDVLLDLIAGKTAGEVARTLPVQFVERVSIAPPES